MYAAPRVLFKLSWMPGATSILAKLGKGRVQGNSAQPNCV